MKTILVLEDEEYIREFIVINLKRNGYTVIECATGQQALDTFAVNSHISIAILDVMLPDIDGFTICKKIRGNEYENGNYYAYGQNPGNR